MKYFNRLGYGNQIVLIRIVLMSILMCLGSKIILIIPTDAPVWIQYFIAGSCVFFIAQISWFDLPVLAPVRKRVVGDLQKRIKYLERTIAIRQKEFKNCKDSFSEHIDVNLIMEIDSMCRELIGIITFIDSREKSKVSVDE